MDKKQFNGKFINFINKFYTFYKDTEYTLILNEKLWLDKKVMVNCHKHGLVRGLTNSAVVGSSRRSRTPCLSCNLILRGKLRAIPQEEWINRCTKIHRGTFCYKNTVYKGCKEEVEILCLKCNRYSKTVADNHLQGMGCNLCAVESRAALSKLRTGKRKQRLFTAEEFTLTVDSKLTEFQKSCADTIVNSNLVLGWGVTITEREGFLVECSCKDNIFISDGYSKIKNMSCGCIKSNIISVRNFNEALITANSLGICTDLYTLEDYKEGYCKVYCDKHGIVKLPVARRRLETLSSWCRKCSMEVSGINCRHTPEEALVIFNKRVDTSKYAWLNPEEYTTSKADYQFKCLTTGKQFTHTFTGLTIKGACSCCRTNGYRKDKKGYLYFIYYTSPTDSFLKMGITNVSAEKRLRQQTTRSSQYEGIILDVFEDEDGGFIANLEYNISNKFDNITIDREQFKDGFTECYDLKNYREMLSLAEEYLIKGDSPYD